jgi:hypothetical protein
MATEMSTPKEMTVLPPNKLMVRFLEKRGIRVPVEDLTGLLERLSRDSYENNSYVVMPDVQD